MDKTSPTNIEGNAIIHNAQGDVVAIVTDINKNDPTESNKNNSAPQQAPHLLSTNSNQNASILPPLAVDNNVAQNTAIKSDTVVPPNLNNAVSTNNNGANSDEIRQNEQTQQPAQSRWTKDNRMILKQLMGSLPPYDIGAALRVILDTFGVESSKLVRRGEFIELDLKAIKDDYILDSLWNYCAQMQFNIMSTLQQQQLQQQQVHYQPMQHQGQGAQMLQCQPAPPVQGQMLQPMQSQQGYTHQLYAQSPQQQNQQLPNYMQA